MTQTSVTGPIPPGTRVMARTRGASLSTSGRSAPARSAATRGTPHDHDQRPVVEGGAILAGHLRPRVEHVKYRRRRRRDVARTSERQEACVLGVHASMSLSGAGALSTSASEICAGSGRRTSTAGVELLDFADEPLLGDACLQGVLLGPDAELLGDAGDAALVRRRREVVADYDRCDAAGGCRRR